jgi:hypothetical protein
MGLFCVNMHFRSTDDKALSAAVGRRGVTRFHIAHAKNDWTSLYEERASQQDDVRIRELAGGLSRDLRVAAIAFMVHDSDIACYWLFDNGQLLDEYNSCPDYFDDDAAEDGTPNQSGGRTDVLVRYCRPGVRQDELAEILTQDAVFAEGVIEGLAAALEIDPERALADYRDVAGGESGGDASDDDDDDGDGDGGSNPSRLPTGVMDRLTAMLGTGGRSAAADPQVLALVEAAARDDLDEIDRLLAEGVAIDGEAPTSLADGQPPAGVGQLFPGGAPRIPMTPLLAAVMKKRRRAAARLLDNGSDPNRPHPLFGTAVHVAAGAGDAELLQLILDRRGDVNARNAQAQTPLQVIAAVRATKDRLDQVQAMIKSTGVKLPGLAAQLSNVALPTEGWDACERLLKAKGAR